ncbi:hypothetical protein Ahia01_000838300, partial [Argonauta hians]
SKKKVKDMKVSVWDINHAMAQALAGVFCPTDTLRLEREYLPGSEPWYLVSTLCPKPDTKMILLSHRPCHHTWTQTLTTITTSFSKTTASRDKQFKSISNFLIGRGINQSDCFMQASQKQQQQIEKRLGCVSWNSSPVNYWFASSTLPADKVPSVTLASNTAHVTDFLQKTLNKAKAMYDNGAYLHWYWRHGASQNDFQNAFESVRGIIENYEECAVIS